MMKRILNYIKKWWRKHIIDNCPPELEDEYSNKNR